MSIQHIQNELENIRNNSFEIKEIKEIKSENDETNLSKLEIFLNNKVINIYKRPWKKLEVKLKIKKVEEYINNEDLNEQEKTKYIGIITKYIKNKTKINIVYDENQEIIETLDYKSIKI